MGKNIKKILSVFIAVLLIFSYIPTAFAINEEAEALFIEAAKTKATTVTLPTSVTSGNSAVSKFTNEFLSKDPEYFYVDISECKFYTSGNTEMAYFDYTDKQIKDFNNKVDEIAEEAENYATAFDKVLFVHEYLLDSCDYDYTYTKRTAYECLMEGSAVCEGYAKAFVCIMHKLGIECAMVTSELNNHAWNMVKLNGKWYYLDITHDDTLGKVHTNFLMSGDNAVTLGHKIGTYSDGSYGDWLFNGVTNCTKTYNNKEFDNGFWVNAKNIMNYKDGVWYYTNGLDVYSCKYGSSAEKLTNHNEKEYRWNVYGSTSSYYEGNYSDAVICGDRIFYSTAKTIRSINFDGSDDKEVYTLSESQLESGYIYDLRAEENRVYISLCKKPSDTPEEIGYIEGYEIHTHNMSEWIVVKHPSCTVTGIEARKCTVEGCIYTEVREVDAVEHTYGDWITVDEPSCVDTGTERRYCSVCKTYEERTVKALGHNYGEKENIQVADCTNAGVYTQKCTRCDDIKTTAVPAKGHTYTEWNVIENATCKTIGSKTRTCTVCGKIETAQIPVTEHKYSDWVEVTPATCSSDGIKTKTCEICGDTVSAAITTLEHVFSEWETVKEATCIETGTRKRVCTLCGATQTEEIPLTEHTVLEWYSATNTGNILGGLVNTEALKGYVVATCYTDGKEHGTCTVCGQEIDRVIPKLEHNFETEIITQPTCTKNGTGYRHCTNNFCFYSKKELVSIPATGHQCDNWTVTATPTCTTEGERTGICNVCEEEVIEVIPALGHDYSEWKITSPASCTKSGIKTRVCKVCGETETEKIDITEHDYGEWIYVTVPTCTTSGFATRVCSLCGKTEDQKVEALGHQFSEWKLEDDGSSIRVCTVCGAKETQAPAFILGDVNGDKLVKVTDARLVLRYSAKLEELDATAVVAADVDYDGKVNAKDARLILRYSAKLISSFE